MARQISLPSVLAVLLIAGAAAAAASSFDEANPIRMVSDRLRELEEQVAQVLGRTRRSLSFARFAHR